MKQTMHRLSGLLLFVVFVSVCILSPFHAVFASESFALSCNVKLGDVSYEAMVNTAQKTMTVYFDASNTTLSQLKNAEVTITSNEGYVTSDAGNIQDLSSPVVYTFDNAGTYTLTAVMFTPVRSYDATDATLNENGVPSDESTHSYWVKSGSGGSVSIGSDGSGSFITLTKNAQSEFNLYSKFKSSTSNINVDEFYLGYRLRVSDVTQAANNIGFAHITTSCVDKLLLTTTNAPEGKFYIGHRDATEASTNVITDKAFNMNQWYDIEYHYKELRTPSSGENPYMGYICELYIDGEYFKTFTSGIYGWRIEFAGRFTKHDTNYEQLGICGFTKALYTIDLDDFEFSYHTGNEVLKAEPVINPDPGVNSDGNVDSDGSADSDGDSDIPGTLEGPIDYNFDFNGEGWNTTNYNIIVNGGFEEVDEDGWRRGSTDMADVGYTTEKAYSGSQSSYMIFPDEFPAGSKNTDNAYGAFRDYGVYSIVPFATYDISMAVIASGINNDDRHNAQLSFRTTNDAAGNKAVQGEEGGFCKITEDVSDWTVVRGRYKPSREDEKYVTQLCTRMRGTNGTKGYFDDMYFGTMQRVVKNTETGMEDAPYAGSGLMQIGAYNEVYGPQEVKSILVECEESKTYLLNAWTKVDSDKASSKIKVEFLDESGKVIKTEKSADCVNTDWTKAELYATAPKGAKNLRMVLCANGCGLASFDSVSLEKQTSVETSFSGIVPGKLGLPKSATKEVVLNGVVLDQFGTDMEVTPVYELAQPVSGVSITSNVITLTNAVSKGSVIKIKATYGNLSEFFEWHVDDIVTYVVSGNNKIKLPDVSLVENYNAVMKNRDGITTVLSDGQVYWYIENPQNGISVDQSGALTITKDAPLGDYILAAKWLSDPEYIAKVTVNIYKEATVNPGGVGGGSSSSGSGGGSFSGSPSFVPVNPDAANPVPNTPSASQPGTDSIYSDLPETHWAYNEIAEFTKKGIINGKGNGNFDSEGMVTRAEFIKILLGALGIDAATSDDIAFNDVNADSWYAPYVSMGVKLNLIGGTGDNKFAPDEAITRQDAATIIYRALVASGNTPSAEGMSFADDASISGYAKDAVSALSSAGIINGMGDGTFRPTENTTRAQAVVILYRMCNMLP